MDASGWDNRYAEGRQWSLEPNQFFADALKVGFDPGAALDLATGEGRNAVWLAQQGWRVTAVDFSSVGIERARAGEASLDPPPPHPIDWLVADLAHYDLGQKRWDLITHIYLHWAQPERSRFLARCADAVALGGHLVVVGHDRSNIEQGHGGPQDPRVLTTPTEVSEELSSAGLVVDRADLVYRHLTVPVDDGPDTRPVTAIDHIVIAHRPDL